MGRDMMGGPFGTTRAFLSPRQLRALVDRLGAFDRGERRPAC